MVDLLATDEVDGGASGDGGDAASVTCVVATDVARAGVLDALLRFGILGAACGHPVTGIGFAVDDEARECVLELVSQVVYCVCSYGLWLTVGLDGRRGEENAGEELHLATILFAGDLAGNRCNPTSPGILYHPSLHSIQVTMSRSSSTHETDATTTTPLRRRYKPIQYHDPIASLSYLYCGQ